MAVRYVLRILILQKHKSDALCVVEAGRADWTGKALDAFLVPVGDARWIDRKLWCGATAGGGSL